LIIALILSLPAARAASPEYPPLTIATEDAPPISDGSGGEVSGLATEIVRRAMDQVGVGYSIAVYPRKRGFDIALRHANSCVYALNRTAEREPRFKWVGPLLHGGWDLYAMADNRTEVSSLAALKTYRVGSTGGDAISIYLRQNGLNPEEVQAADADELNIRKLQSGRIDFWATGRLRGSYIGAKLGASLRHVMVLREVGLYLACNRSVDDKLIASLNDALRR